jgi:(p)ppGpp synthase/HD superfamily hydrolase
MELHGIGINFGVAALQQYRQAASNGVTKMRIVRLTAVVVAGDDDRDDAPYTRTETATSVKDSRNEIISASLAAFTELGHLLSLAHGNTIYVVDIGFRVHGDA